MKFSSFFKTVKKGLWTIEGRTFAHFPQKEILQLATSISKFLAVLNIVTDSIAILISIECVNITHFLMEELLLASSRNFNLSLFCF